MGGAGGDVLDQRSGVHAGNGMASEVASEVQEPFWSMEDAFDLIGKKEAAVGGDRDGGDCRVIGQEKIGRKRARPTDEKLCCLRGGIGGPISWKDLKRNGTVKQCLMQASPHGGRPTASAMQVALHEADVHTKKKSVERFLRKHFKGEHALEAEIDQVEMEAGGASFERLLSPAAELQRDAGEVVELPVGKAPQDRMERALAQLLAEERAASAAEAAAASRVRALQEELDAAMELHRDRERVHKDAAARYNAASVNSWLACSTERGMTRSPSPVTSVCSSREDT